MNTPPSDPSSQRFALMAYIALALALGSIVGYFSGFGPMANPRTMHRAGLGEAEQPSAPPEEPPVAVELSNEVASPKDLPPSRQRKELPPIVIERPRSPLVVVNSSQPDLAANQAPVRGGLQSLSAVPTGSGNEPERVGELRVSANLIIADPKQDHLWVAEENSTRLLVFDTAKQKLIQRVPTDLVPTDFCLGSKEDMLYLVGESRGPKGTASYLSVRNFKTFAEQRYSPMPGRAEAIESDGKGNLFVLCSGEPKAIVMLDDTTLEELARITDARFQKGGFLGYSKEFATLYHGDQNSPATLTSISVRDRKLEFAQESGALGNKGKGLVVSNKGEFLCFFTATGQAAKGMKGHGAALIPGDDIKATFGSFELGNLGASKFRGVFSLDDESFFATDGGQLRGFSTRTFEAAFSLPFSKAIKSLALNRDGTQLFVGTTENVGVYRLRSVERNGLSAVR